MLFSVKSTNRTNRIYWWFSEAIAVAEKGWIHKSSEKIGLEFRQDSGDIALHYPSVSTGDVKQSVKVKELTDKSARKRFSSRMIWV